MLSEASDGRGRSHTEYTEMRRGVVHGVELALDRRAQRRGEGTGENVELGQAETSEVRKGLTQSAQRHRGS